MDEKLSRLKASLREYKSVAVAFSGGADSAFLLEVARDELGEDAFAVIAETPFLHRCDMREAEAFCEARDIPLVKVAVDTLAEDAVANNLPERCYVCKRAMFEALADAAAERGAAVVVDGSHADDASEHRPGAKALVELGVKSPLRDAGLTKAEVRALSRERGLPTWEKPSNACLATRFPYGQALDAERLAAVAEAEELLHGLEFEQVRVRVHGDLARIEVYPAQLCRLVEPSMRRFVADRLRELGFAYICADIEGFRSGSMDVSE